MRSYVKRCVTGLVLFLVLSGCVAASAQKMIDTQERHNQEVVAEKILFIKTVDELVVALVIDPGVSALVGSDISQVFIRNGWRGVTPTDNDTLIDTICHLDSEESTISAQCQVDISVEIKGQTVIMPPAYGSILFDQQIVDLFGIDRFKQSIVELVMIQEVDATNAAEEKLRFLKQK